MALALLLRDLSEYGKFTVVALAHLNHRVRSAADADEKFCRELGKRLGVEFVAESADVPAAASASGLSIEDAARRIRYEFLERTAETLGADRVAVGHTQDDQAETFLMKLIRGAGLTGLAGIYPQRGIVVRPLLDVSRAELREFLRNRDQTWVEDETNADLDNPRNRIRHRVLPELDQALGGATKPAIARSAALAREDGQWLNELADKRYETLVTQLPGGLELDAAALAATPTPLRRRVLLRALRQSAGGREVTVEHVEAAMAVAAGANGPIDIPGCRVELRRGKVVLVGKAPSK